MHAHVETVFTKKLPVVRGEDDHSAVQLISERVDERDQRLIDRSQRVEHVPKASDEIFVNVVAPVVAQQGHPEILSGVHLRQYPHERWFVRHVVFVVAGAAPGGLGYVDVRKGGRISGMPAGRGRITGLVIFIAHRRRQGQGQIKGSASLLPSNEIHRNVSQDVRLVMLVSAAVEFDVVVVVAQRVIVVLIQRCVCVSPGKVFDPRIPFRPTRRLLTGPTCNVTAVVLAGFSAVGFFAAGLTSNEGLVIAV